MGCECQLEKRCCACRSVLDNAIVCGLDAEWRPNARVPSATLVQLAFHNSGSKTHVLLLVSSANPLHPDYGQYFRVGEVAQFYSIYRGADALATLSVQDMQSLSTSLVKDFLQQLFRSPSILKVIS